MKLRHIVSINDLTEAEIEAIFSLADRYLAELGDPESPCRIGKSTDTHRSSIMATLFYEPSTRTRLSFESAMSRLGGNIISSADPKASSAVKGETLADAVRIVSGYADVLVLRHPSDGAARLAADYASVPLINGGDGAHEHPTQTLCDLFTIRRERGSIEDLTVALLGDLKGGRTAHSLVYALARFGANIVLMPAHGLALPDAVVWRLREEFGYAALRPSQFSALGPRAVAAYARQGASSELDRIDVLYVTRFQKERSAEAVRDYPVVDAAFLATPGLRNALVLHPLPRVDELGPAFDADSRAAYFRQASHGVPIRMALLTLLLNGDPNGLERFEGGFRPANRHTALPSGLRCANDKCIGRDENESAAAPKFQIVSENPCRLRCFWCETDSTGVQR